MSRVELLASDPHPNLQCASCDQEYQYDPLMGYGCLILLDQRQIPHTILGAWCDESCLNQWLDTSEAKDLLAPGM